MGRKAARKTNEQVPEDEESTSESSQSDLDNDDWETTDQESEVEDYYPGSDIKSAVRAGLFLLSTSGTGLALAEVGRLPLKPIAIIVGVAVLLDMVSRITTPDRQGLISGSISAYRALNRIVNRRNAELNPDWVNPRLEQVLRL